MYSCCTCNRIVCTGRPKDSQLEYMLKARDQEDTTTEYWDKATNHSIELK